MDTTPLYSAEQIVVPEELADILKQYTKSVIRAQPQNILEFSAKYFEELVRTKGRVTKNQLRKLRKQFEQASEVTTETIKAYCGQHQISKEVVNAISSRMSTNEWQEFVGLACTLLGQDFLTSMEAVFGVFDKKEEKDDDNQPTLEKDILVKLLGYIGKHDPQINSQFINAIGQSLSQEPQITYGEFMQLQVVRGLRR